MGIASGRIDERDISLLTPCPIALAASWDTGLIQAIGDLVADEALKRGIDVVLAPNVNLARSPLAGRLFEMFSEDPYLTGALASAWIQGLQARGVGAAVKHFVANDSETDRHSMNSVVDEQTLRQVYLQPFERCVRAGVWALMTAYNRINGEWCSSARELISDVVKGEWGFDGIVMSDWFGTHATVADASAGLDLEMPGPARYLGASVAAAVTAGSLPEDRVTDAAERLLRLAKRVDDRTASVAAPHTDALALLERAAIEGCVLLRNEGMLPLKPGDGMVAVIGPNAETPTLQGGSFARIAIDPTRPDPVSAISARFGANNVRYERGLAPDARLPALHACDIFAPTGEHGVLVEVLDEAGKVLFSETRNTSLLIWFAEMPGLGRLDQSGGIRVRTRFRARASGEHLFYFGGTGSTRLSIDGAEVGLQDPHVAPADIMGALMSGASEHISRNLQAGDELDLDYHMGFKPARAQGIWFGCGEPETAGRTTAAITLAREADSVVLFVGESQDAALESIDRTTTRLSDAQVALIEVVCDANPRTLVVVNAARPVLMDWAERPAAILQVWFPGQEFATAVAKILAGDEEPGGRLPLTFAVAEVDYPAFDLTPDVNGDLRYHERDAVGYRSLLAAGKTARYPFGHGLGYADIDLQLPTWLDGLDHPVFSATLNNRSGRAGKAVVQLYLEPEVQNGMLAPPRLVAFHSIRVAAGASETVRLFADPHARRLWEPENGLWREPGGRSRYTIGLSAEDRRFSFQNQ